MKILVQIIFLFLIAYSSFGQHPKVNKARALIEAGKSSKAIALLNKSFKKSNDKELALELIHLYSEENNLRSAWELANKISLDNSQELSDAIVYTDLLIQNGDYKKALDKCIAYSLRHQDAQPLHDRAYTCENLLKAQKKSILFEIHDVPFNASTDEVKIANYRRNYVMASNRVDEMAAESNSLQFDLFMLGKDYNKWRYPEFLLNEKDKKHSRTSLCYTIDGNRVFYTLVDFTTAKAKKKVVFDPQFRLYEAISMGNEWVEREMLPFQKDGFKYKDPAIHPEGNLLVYSADLKGEGGFDLFYSEWVDDAWTAPKAVGDQVNTPYNETMAYFDEEGNLYFSSDNKLGFGGYDIYQTREDNGIWLKPAILPPPVNSAYDDLSFVKHYSRTGGYLASNRPGGRGGFDIYEYSEIDLKLGVSVIDQSNGNLVELAEVKLLRDDILLDHRLSNEKGIAEFSIGRNAEYEIKVIKEGFKIGESTVRTRAAVEGRTLYWNVKLTPDPDYQPAKPVQSDEEASNYVAFTAEVVDGNGQPIPGLPVRMVNSSARKIKMVETNENGRFSQDLLLGNNYEFVMEYNEVRFVGVFSTIGLLDGSPKFVRYTITGEAGEK